MTEEQIMAGKKYKLVLYIAKTSLTESKMSANIKKVIRKHREEINFSINESNIDYYSITIEGSIDSVDSCHRLLNKNILLNFQHIRVCDEAGDEIRKRAFIVLSRIEQRLRTFIGQAMVEIIGWNWWDKWICDELKEKAKKRRSGSKEDLLELIDFGDLISIMTANVRDWKDKKLITVSDIKDLLDENNTIEELKDTLQSRTQDRSIWDQVFSIYFEDAKEWIKLKEELEKKVLGIRNKVMHHRPVHIYDLDTLKSADQKFRKILDTVKEKLTQTEKDEAQSGLEEMASTMFQHWRELKEEASNQIAEQWGFQSSSMADVINALSIKPPISMIDMVNAYREESPIVDGLLKMKERLES